jgi:predicted DNA-binding protein
MLSVRLGQTLENQLNFLAKENNTSKSQIIKDSLTYYFEMLQNESKQKSAYELGNDLFGKFSSGQNDLSTTYKQKLKDKINAKNNH